MTKVYIDIETVAGKDRWIINEVADNTKPPGSMKKAETIENWYETQYDAALQKNLDKCALDGAMNQIVSIAWAVDDDEPTVEYGEDEQELLRVFLKEIPSEMAMYVGHNIYGFDLKVIRQRAIINGLSIPSKIKYAMHSKPWQTDYVFDTMVQWDAKNFISMDKLCKALGLEGKGDITGADVAALYAKGKLDDIAEYNKSDVEKVRKAAKKMFASLGVF